MLQLWIAREGCPQQPRAHMFLGSTTRALSPYAADQERYKFSSLRPPRNQMTDSSRNARSNHAVVCIYLFNNTGQFCTTVIAGRSPSLIGVRMRIRLPSALGMKSMR